MYHSHQLDKQKDQDFLLQQRVDPITGELIEAGHKIVICSSCKSAFFEESWQYLGGKHCNQEKTLTKIPVAQTLWLKAKPLEFLPFDFEGFDKGFHYQKFTSRLLKTIIGLCSYATGIFCFIALDEKKFKLLPILLLVFFILLFLSISYEQLIKKLPISIYKYLTLIHKEHKLAIDLKKQTLVFRNDFQEIELSLSSIHKLNYSFLYVTEDISRYKDMCDLRMLLGFSEKGIYKERTITAQFRKIYFYKWEEFLQKLPSTIQIQTT